MVCWIWPFLGKEIGIALSSIVYFSIFFAVPTFLIWNAKRLAGKITFLSLRGPDKEPPWAVAAIGFILHGIQLIYVLLPRVIGRLIDLD